MARRIVPVLFLFVALVLSAAILGFFYAWVCSTMWGLDAADPRVAIAAMQAMNASVRNAMFFPAFFLTPVMLAVAAIAVSMAGSRAAAAALAAAAIVYLAGAFAPTALVNVPMNEALAALAVPVERAAAEAIWADYSSRWQWWNALRAAACLVAFLFAATALYSFARHTGRSA